MGPNRGLHHIIVSPLSCGHETGGKKVQYRATFPFVTGWAGLSGLHRRLVILGVAVSVAALAAAAAAGSVEVWQEGRS